MSLSTFQRRRRELKRKEVSLKQEEQEEKIIESSDEGIAEENECQNESVSNFEELKVTELKEMAKERGIEGYLEMKKAELIEVLTK